MVGWQEKMESQNLGGGVGILGKEKATYSNAISQERKSEGRVVGGKAVHEFMIEETIRG